jgi:hypothetical protein
MNPTFSSKQFVTDEAGNQIGVILPIADYLLVESLLRQHQPKPVPTREQRRKQLQRAVEIMHEEYAKDAELTAFTALEGEDFVE